MTRSDMPWEWPKRCFSWPEEALLTNDEDFVYLPRQQSVTERILRHWRAKCGKSGQLEKNRTTVLLPLSEVR